ncbi:MAG: ABC transporter permease [Thermoplasmatota archaeon]
MTRFYDIIRQAVGGLQERRIRTLLTILGIVVGSAPIVALVAATQGQSQAIQQQLNALGSTTLIVRAQGTTTLTNADVAKIGAMPGVGTAIPAVLGSGIAFQTNKTTGNVTVQVNVTVLGINLTSLPKFLPSIKVANGTLGTNRTLVGSYVSAPPGGAAGLGPVGSNYTLNASLGGGPGGFRGSFTSGAGGGGRTFGGGGRGGFRFRFAPPKNYEENTSIGAVAAPFGASGVVEVDSTVFMPLVNAQKFLNETSGYNEIIVLAKSPDDVANVQAEIQAAYPAPTAPAGAPSGFGRFAAPVNVQSPAAEVQTVQGVYAQVGILLASVAAIGVVVAGIGIANTMLVSVLERTTEIGVLKALGFTGRTILGIFVFEALIAGVIGGVIGCLVGAGLSFGLGGFLNPQALAARGAIGRGAASAAITSQPVFTWWLFAGVLLFAIIVALLAGILPARKAARMDPVIALKRM